MALRKASSYSKFKARPYTRHSRKKGKAYIKTIPHTKLVKYYFGNQKAYAEGKHNFMLKLIAEQDVQVRDNAIEAGRMYIHKMLEEGVPGEYFLAVKVHPHHLLRDNKTAAGAGADRTSSGMSHSFGIVIGRAALVKAGKEIFKVTCVNEKGVKIARDALNAVKSKIPAGTKIVFEQIKSNVQ
ncbi:MAG: 50S ribosomal protein L16 [Candidatus Pacearchaeota archaeon]